MQEKIIIGGELRLKLKEAGELFLHRTIDGQVGIFTPVYPDVYTGETVVIPMAYEAQVLECKNKTMPDDVTVTRVPYFETSNEDGTTVYIASEVQ